jgi:hypothetical protein
MATRESILKDYEEVKKDGISWQIYYDSLSNQEKLLVSDLGRVPSIGTGIDNIQIAAKQHGTPSTYTQEMINKYNAGQPTAKPFKMPTWGWVGIGVGGAAIITLIIVFGIKAARKK